VVEAWFQTVTMKENHSPETSTAPPHMAQSGFSLALSAIGWIVLMPVITGQFIGCAYEKSYGENRDHDSVAELRIHFRTFSRRTSGSDAGSVFPLNARLK
jgi:hypothetical protein